MSLRYIDGDGNEKFIAGGGGGSADIIPLTEAEFKDKYEKGELEEGKYYAITNDVDPDSIEQQLINLGTQLNGIEAIVKADGETLPVGSGTIFGAVKALDDKIDDVNQKLDKHTLGAGVGLTLNTKYTCPTDGYVTVKISYASGSYANLSVNDSILLMLATSTGMAGFQQGSLYVKKGMTLEVAGSNVTQMTFIPLG